MQNVYANATQEVPTHRNGSDCTGGNCPLRDPLAGTGMDQCGSLSRGRSQYSLDLGGMILFRLAWENLLQR